MIVMRIEIDESRGVDFTQRTTDAVLKATNYAIAKRWQDLHLPLHFRVGNRKRYNLPPRKAAYRRRKRAIAANPRPGQPRVLKGGAVALVFSGLAMELFGQRHAIRATPRMSKIKMHGPRYVMMRPYKSQRHAIGPQVLKVIPKERTDLETFAQDFMAEAYRRAPPRRRRRRVT